MDTLFRSVADVYCSSSLSVVLTGMGSDGLKGSQKIYEAGGEVLVQDEASSVVWGMPGYIANAGIALKILPIPAIAEEVRARMAVRKRI